MNWIELGLRQWPLSKSELYRNIVKPARREAAIEMPHSRNDHSDDRDVDVGARLIEDEEIEPLSHGETHARGHLLVSVETVELRAEAWLDCRIVAWRQKVMVPQAHWSGAIKARFLSSPAPHETDGQELV